MIKNLSMELQEKMAKKIEGYFFIIFFFLSLILTGYAKDRPKVGLVLSGGGAKGFAHIGTLQMLDSLKIPVDYIVGTSVGGIVGALYAIGYSGFDLEKIAFNIHWQEIFTDRPSRVLLPYFEKKDTGKYQIEFGLEKMKLAAPSGLIFGQNISLLFSSLTFPYEGIDDFDNLPIPFRCVTVDLVTGNQVVLKNGSLSKAMRATMAAPSIFSPVEWDNFLLVDGGLVNNLPIDVAKEMGAEIIIAVDLERPLMERKDLNSGLAILQQTIALIGEKYSKKNVEKADILIKPDLKGYFAADFFDDDRIKNIINIGKDAAHQSLSQLVALKEKYKLQKIEVLDKLEQSEKERRNFRLMITEGESVISSIAVAGNENLSSLFIHNLLGLKSGDRLNIKKLHRCIMEMYGLGYFEQIQYNLESIGQNQVNLKLTVKELPRRKLRLGIRYDDFHKLVGVASMQATNLLVPGLRFEDELQFAGLTYFNSKIYYPSRTLNLPVYPFLRLGYKNVPTCLYDEDGDRIASYKNRSYRIGMGLGLLFAKSFNTEISYEWEYMNLRPNIVSYENQSLFPSLKDSLRKIQATMTFDMLDDVLLPKKGILINASYEGSFKRLKSDIYYYIFDVYADFYLTYLRRHTARIYGYWGTSSPDLPVYKFLNQGRPNIFVGMYYDQLQGSKMSLLRFDYRYEYKRFLYFKFMANVALNYEYRLPAAVFTSDNMFGFGFGLMFVSPIGPIELIYSRGSKSIMQSGVGRDIWYFTFGTKF